MLLSLVLLIRPRTHATLPADQGRALAAEFLRWVEEHDKALSEELHTENETRPYTVSGLRGVSHEAGQVLLLPDRPVWWRVTTLTPTLSQFIQNKVISSLPETMALGDQLFDLLSATLDPHQHPWAGQTTYEDLAAGKIQYSIQ